MTQENALNLAVAPCADREAHRDSGAWDQTGWFPFEEVVKATGMSPRTARRALKLVPDNCIRFPPSTGGRPRAEYHFEALPQLRAAHARATQPRTVTAEPSPSMSSVPSVVSASPAKSQGVAIDDLARAELRLMAITEYEARLPHMTAEQAAEATAADWSARQRSKVVQMPNGRKNPIQARIVLKSFEAGTLRNWVSIWKKSGSLLDLADTKKGHSGRTPTPISDDAMTLMRTWSASTARADVVNAKARLEARFPDFPRISADTWRRRLKAIDPRGAARGLMHSLPAFRAGHLPDVEINWNSLSYNGRFEVDDVQQDWAALSSDYEFFLRPYAYAVVRVRTRQWIAFVVSATRITDAQVGALIGFTMAEPMGGIPDEWKLENRNVTSTGHLITLLQALGSKVSHTSMDGGRPAFRVAVPDCSAGHPQGHGVIERMNKKLHRAAALEAMQVGSEERHTAPLRLQKFKEACLAQAKQLAEEARDRNEVLVEPGPDEWAARTKAFMETINNTPTSGLQRIVDPATGETRHMTPNECAVQLKDQAIRLMDEKFLPMFCTDCEEVTVTKNGVKINNRSYGRGDIELQRHDKVKVFVSEMWPDFAYIEQLGRCVDAYIKEEPGVWQQFGEKMRQDALMRGDFSTVMEKSISLDPSLRMSAMCVLSNPTPARVKHVVTPESIAKSLAGIKAAVAEARARRAAQDRRFDPVEMLAVSGEPVRPSSRRSMAQLEEELTLQETVFTTAKED